MVNAFLLSFIQLREKSFRRVFWIGLVGSTIIFLVLWTVMGFLFVGTDVFEFNGKFGILNKILELVAEFFGASAVIFLSWLLFPAVVSVIVSFFLEDVAEAVEAKHYPNLPEARFQGVFEGVIVTLKFACLSIVLNILALPIYVVLFFIGPLNLVIFYILNGFLLGREFFDLVVYRRATPDQARYIRRAYKAQLFLAGVVIAFIMTVPLVNLIASVFATSAMVHLTHNWLSSLEHI